MIVDIHIDLAWRLATVLKQIWQEADGWNDDAKHAIAALSHTADGALDYLDKQSVSPSHTTDRWQFGVAVTRWSRSMQLLYIEPG